MGTADKQGIKGMQENSGMDFGRISSSQIIIWKHRPSEF